MSIGLGFSWSNWGHGGGHHHGGYRGADPRQPRAAAKTHQNGEVARHVRPLFFRPAIHPFPYVFLRICMNDAWCDASHESIAVANCQPTMARRWVTGASRSAPVPALRRTANDQKTHYGDSNEFQTESIGCRGSTGFFDVRHGCGADQDRRVRSIHRRLGADGRVDARRRQAGGATKSTPRAVVSWAARSSWSSATTKPRTSAACRSPRS
jgi:hypothetical protein